ncbi:N-6 DNA methylase [Kitasatospora sp. NPDC004289]
MNEQNPVPVTLAQIARVAGVGRAAVSNWRRRDEGFPAPLGGTDTSPTFSLTEVENWLLTKGKGRAVGDRERLWPKLDALGDRTLSGMAVAGMAHRHTPAGISLADLPENVRSLTAEAVELGAREGLPGTFDFLLTRWLEANVRQISATPVPLAELMASLAFLARSTPTADPITVHDPACGTGGLLAATAAVAQRQDPAPRSVVLTGTEVEPVLAALADARLSFSQGRVSGSVRLGDSLRSGPDSDVAADLVLCNPPFNQRDWGHEELATDRRWVYGLPPRTEPELAWVQHALSCLTPGGTGVLALPPAVASRKAGRRIRGALLRAGALRAVIALPAGAAPPYSVSLHLWVLQSVDATDFPAAAPSVLMVDAASKVDPAERKALPINWPRLGEQILDALESTAQGLDPAQGAAAHSLIRAAAVPLIELLDDEVDLTPARHTPVRSAGYEQALTHTWAGLDRALEQLAQAKSGLRAIDRDPSVSSGPGTTTVGELVRAGALTLRTGHLPAEPIVRPGTPEAGGLPVLTIGDLLMHEAPSGWLDPAEAAAAGLVIARPGDVVVAGVARTFSAWVETRPALVLGPQLCVLRPEPALLDPDFLAGCLRAPANGRQAGTHASVSARVDVRRLQVLQLPVDEQLRYGAAFRRVSRLDAALHELHEVGAGLLQELSDGLAAGRLPQDWRD